MPLIEILARIEMNGVKIDKNYFAKMAVENDKKLLEIEKNINELAEENFNINSTKELSRILFEKIGLKPVKKTKTGFSTDISVLEALKGKHDIINNLISYRTLNKLKTTYIDTLPKLISENTGRIHTSYNQTVVATGRLSSSEPNVQNIPIKGEVRSQIRKGFVSEQNSLILAADYSQVELRIVAHYSQDKNMLKAYREGIDIHSMTGASMFGVATEDLTREMRNHAKVVNFSVIYKVSPFGLSKQADISFKEAEDFINKYFEMYPGVKDYFEKTINFAQEHKYVETLMGRRRAVPDIDANSSFSREAAERVAVNSPIQGTSADMIKLAMIEIDKALKEKNLKTKMIMQVHDELVFEVPVAEKDIIEKLVKDKMENALKLEVPIVVDLGWGANWEEAH
jgi:DNA polymerase-1